MSGVVHVIDDSSGAPGVARPLKTSDLAGGGIGHGATADASAANQLTQIARLEAIRERLPAGFLTPGLLPVDTLGTPVVTRHFVANASALSPVALTATTRRVSVDARVDVWIAFNATAAVIPAGQSGASVPVGAGAIKDFDCPAGTTVSVLRAGTTDGSVFVTELV